MNLHPLSAIFGAVAGARNALYDRRLLRPRSLQGPVISVGNISTGGSGKTPFVILLGELLKARGIRFDVLSRGYGRTTRGVLLVEPSGLPQDFGDEPLLIARRLQAPVVVGEDRYEAGRFAEDVYKRQLFQQQNNGYEQSCQRRNANDAVQLEFHEGSLGCLLYTSRCV